MTDREALDAALDDDRMDFEDAQAVLRSWARRHLDVMRRLKAEWFRNGMHDIKQTTEQNNVPPLTLAEVRSAVAGFERQLFAALNDTETP